MSVSADGIFNEYRKKAEQHGIDIIVDERRLTFREWFRWRIVRQGGDPRISFPPIRLAMLDFSDPDNWKMVRV